MHSKSLLWLRNDLRLSDNPALLAAMAHGETRAIYIDEHAQDIRSRGAASRWWLHHSLLKLGRDLAEIGVRLETQRGDPEELIPKLVAEHGVEQVHWNRRYAPAERELDATLKAALKRDGIHADSHMGNLLVEPFEIETRSGGPYSVFSPFRKALFARDIPRPQPHPNRHDRVCHDAPFDPDYTPPKWSEKLTSHWQIGEAAAQDRLHSFLDDLVADYPEGRDRPARDATSRLSPHLAFGEISPRQIWHAALAVAQTHPERIDAIDKFLSELAWRDFNHVQLFFRDNIATTPMVEKFAAMDWRTDPDAFAAWQQGRTGIPIVDAGMRELWETGYMHNRVRMLVASLLTKNLLIDWREGERWFWDTLVDADAANNPGNWQWVAGCGLDAAPYFRIFNPVTQGQRFDPAGDYVRHWIPELAEIPDRYIHAPHEAPEDQRPSERVYPDPIVDLKSTRARALSAFKAL